ncbi:MAG: hypothetical protein K1060chlam2_00518 [Chlamydiae bacterium]|nr:hypothetical protein [Chlamydiota bacterium]
MNRYRIFFLILSTFALSTLSAIDDGSPGLEQRDIEALRDWINTKRQVTVKERGGNLSISGEVRAELQSTSETKKGVKQRGNGGAVPGAATRAWDVEVNLMLDYRTDRTWATFKLEFDNNAGIESGTFNRISLERAFFGGRVVNADTYSIDVEIGRRYLVYTFDSRVQFGSFMDGIMFKYDQAFERAGDFYFHGGPFLVNEEIDQYAYVGEFGLLNIGRTGFYSKLSVIDWDTKHTANKERNRAIRFVNIQMIWGYKFVPKKLDKIVTLYAAALANAAAKGTKISRGTKARWAWYAGFSIGELRKQWDWSLDINYQWVQAQAVPDFDGLGIGRGNAAKFGLYSRAPLGNGGPITRKQAVGTGNYKGISIELLYILTSNITVYQAWRQSVNQTSRIGPQFSFKQYEFEIIYGF